jgi:hypothetical protein
MKRSKLAAHGTHNKNHQGERECLFARLDSLARYPLQCHLNAYDKNDVLITDLFSSHRGYLRPICGTHHPDIFCLLFIVFKLTAPGSCGQWADI